MRKVSFADGSEPSVSRNSEVRSSGTVPELLTELAHVFEVGLNGGLTKG
jgi:hypothetical protein